MKRIKLITLLLCCVCFLSAQEPITLDLEQSIQIASENSLEAFRAKNVYEMSYWEYHAFKAARLPSLTLKLTPLQYYRDYTKRYDSQSNIDIFRKQQSLYSSGNLQLSQNFDLTGGTFFIDTELNYMKNFGDGDADYTQFTSVPVRIGYFQSLFGFNSFKWEKRIEPLKYEKAKKQYLYTREEISESVISYFFTLALAQAEFDMATDNAASSDTLYHIGQERHKIAAISQADLLTLKLDNINAKNNLKNAEIELKRAMSSFLSFLNMEKDAKVTLNLPERPRDLTIPTLDAIKYAQENNPDFLVNQQEILEAERDVEQTKKSSKFEADLSVSIGFNQVASKFKDVYRNPSEQDIVSVGLSIPLIDWGVRKGKANMAINNLNVAKIAVEQKEQTLEQDIIMTVSDFNIQQDLISSAEEAMQLAIMAYSITKERYVIGKADMNSLTLALNRQKEAQTNYLSALKNYWLSYYKIRKLTLYDFEKMMPLEVKIN